MATSTPTRSTRTVRLFVSSTFEDLKAERNILQAEVFPALQRRCHGKRRTVRSKGSGPGFPLPRWRKTKSRDATPSN